LGCPEAELSLTLVGDRAMSRLNRETFGKAGPTNVIAFPVDWGEGAKSPAGAGDPSSAPPPFMLGEVVISVETTVRQARQTDWPWEELLDFYLIHGILHLMGYDHRTPADEARMEAETWELMKVVEEGA